MEKESAKKIEGKEAPEKKPAEVASGKKRLPKGVRIALKTVLWTIVSLVALVVVVLSLVVWILTPERLTPLAEKIANENFVHAKVDIGRAELTIWKTFPLASIDVSGLNIQSSVLNQYGDSVPAYADSLLSVGKLHAEIDLSKLPLMRVDIREVLIDSPKANVVALNDSVANYMIFPPSEPDTAKTEMSLLPDVVVRKFRITNNRGLRYTAMAQGLSATVNTDAVALDYNRRDHFYSLLLQGGVATRMPAYHIDQTIPFLFKGDINWNTKNPYRCTLRNFKANVAAVPVTVNALFDLGDTTAVRSMSLAMGPLKYADLIRQVPAHYLHGMDRVKSDFSLAVNLKLDRPFRVGVDAEPSFHADISIPDCYIQPGRYRKYRINRFGLKANMVYDGQYPERTRATLSKLLLDGFGIRLSATGSATNLLADANIKTHVSGALDFARALRLIPKELPIRLSGLMKLDAHAKFRLSDLTVTTFRRAQVDGRIDFTDVRYTVPKDSMLVFARTARIDMGTNSKFRTANGLKSVMHTSVTVDSAFAAVPGMFMTLGHASVGAGVVGRVADLRDTTRVTPIGARIKIDRLRAVNKADSSSIRLDGFESNGSVSRLGDKRRLPLMKFGIKVGRIAYGDRTTHLGLRNGNISLEANPRVLHTSARMQARIDSMSRIYPRLSRDSVVALYRAQQRARHKSEHIDEDEYMDMSLGGKMKDLLRKWDMRGTITAECGRFFSPYFPVRNTLRNVDMDAFNIRNLTYRAGRSDMTMQGSVTNIRRTLMGSHRRPLTLRFNIFSDTLDVNQLLDAAYRGSAFAADTAGRAAFDMTNIDNDAELEAKINQASAQTDTSVTHAIVIPKNVAVDLKIRNHYSRYADLDFTDLRSDLLVNNGVLNLRNLSGTTSDGGMKLDLIYATADRHDIGLGMFMDLKDIRVGRFLQMMPDVDTIMPMLKGVDGIINARMAVTTKVDSLMNVIIPTTNAALHIDGDSLVLLDSETFRSIAKMLMFKNKNRNLVDSLSVEATAFDSRINVYPFILVMDRYRLGVVGSNDFDMNYNYHVSVLKSPLPFKFGINISGNVDDMKIRLGKARLRENEVAKSSQITDSVKINLMERMGEVFRRGAEAALQSEGMSMFDRNERRRLDGERGFVDGDNLSHADSLQLAKEGIITLPPDSDSIKVERKPRNRGFWQRLWGPGKAPAIKPENAADRKEKETPYKKEEE